ncbi:hypothetical protein AWB67_06826 [Caballeronia terrestris]|uniref:Uncharacterized protein n=1 Tax=Caballeronia terrestris TaxID=1226301 RepID=A0A158KVM6_9BURK|nr:MULTISPECIES: hypothetical protein [Caballeronia]SAL06098.1 hypothetical protein AWB81_07444 [Caballeronia arationis]SAL85005.1 hypothetical protein AWB67_06826 [Caballeronia terrestris]
MAEKTWSYGELTRIAEKEIDKLMAEVRTTANFEERVHLQKYAAGVLMGWMAVTFMNREEADEQRLKDKLRLAGIGHSL